MLRSSKHILLMVQSSSQIIILLQLNKCPADLKKMNLLRYLKLMTTFRSKI